MGLLHDLRAPRERGFHGRLVISIMLLERSCGWKAPFRLLRRIICQMVYHCEINPASFVSSSAIASLRLPHPYLIVVHRDVEIGERVTFFHGVTIGAREGRHTGVPVIGSDCYLGTGATVIGPLRLGDGARIGANCLVLSDVAAGETVLSNRV